MVAAREVRSRRRRARVLGPLGPVLTVVGAALGVIAFTTLNWFKSGGSTFSDIHGSLQDVGWMATGPADAYFSWLGWTLLVVAALMALAAVTLRAAALLRILTPIVCLAAIALTVPAIKLIHGMSPILGVAGHLSDYLKDARAGFYLAVLGFVLLGGGAAAGPWRRRAR